MNTATMQTHFKAVLAVACTFAASPAYAQRSNSVDLTVNDVGISIGDSRRVVGLRLNYRDRDCLQPAGGASMELHWESSASAPIATFAA
jgi:hypothetical protein